ncbi:hypothetical protein CBR_g2697 [Chara braunii]|uniref:Integrase zinc-binding domain-containing protein n=1 Tax=Chara braunii TaxID=69332 RepID=A0A388KDR4_CHABU|nr:hypothetical protein CBR_g2697 [Chara braunii]|eukprot:GBG68146.1 hypothetical protein CBR_g2697 [Chara braunii]
MKGTRAISLRSTRSIFCGERVSEWLERVEQALVGRSDVLKFQRILQYVLHSYHQEVKKVIDAAQGGWERFKEGIQRKYRLWDGLLTTADLEAMNKEDFTTIGAFVQEFKKKERKVHGISEEAQCAFFLGLLTASEAIELTRHGGGSTKLTWATIDRGVEVGCLDQVEQRQVRLQRQKRKKRDATTSGTPGVTRIVTDVLAQLGYATELVVQRRVVTAVRVKGKEPVVEEAVQEKLWEEEVPVPQHLTKAQRKVRNLAQGGQGSGKAQAPQAVAAASPSAVVPLSKAGPSQGGARSYGQWPRPMINAIVPWGSPPPARLAQAARTRNQAKASASQEPPRREPEPGRRKEAVKVEDDDDKEEEDERLRREEDQRAEQRARKKGTRGEAEPVIRDAPPKKKKYAVRLEEGFDVEKVIDRLLEGHNDLMTLKEILASALRLRDELKGRLLRRLVPNIHLGTILPKETEWAESGTKMDWKCVACGRVDLVVKGSKCAAMVDTGAEMNIIWEADAIRFGLDIDRSDCGILRGASCEAVFCGTASNVLIEVGKVKVRACFFIMSDVDHGILLGRSFFSRTETVIFNKHDGTLILLLCDPACGNYEIITCRNTGTRSIRNRPNPGSFTIEESEGERRRLRVEPEGEEEVKEFFLSLSDVGKAMDLVATHEMADPDAIQALREQVLECPEAGRLELVYRLPNGRRNPASAQAQSERTLMVELMKRRHRASAFRDEERGRLDVDKIPMISIHTVPHEPWNMRGARYPNPDEEKKVVDYLDERNYSQFKRETLAVLHCLRIFQNYIFGMRFILRVDPTALAYSVRNYVPSDPTVARWLTCIWMFNFEFERIPGSKNRADGLSRINWDKQEGEAVENTPPVDGFLDQEEDVRLHINKWSSRVPSCVGYPIWQASSRYERRAELVLKPFEEEDPWGGKDVQWMMELALASSHNLVEDIRTIEEGPGQVERHEDPMAGMYLLVNTLLQESLDQSSSLNPTGNVDEVPESQNVEFEEGEIKEAFRAEEYDGIYLELGLLLSCEMRLRDASDRAQRMLLRYFVRDGHLFVRREVGNPRRVVCGRNRQIDVVAALHDGIVGGHRGVQATYAKISELYYWDGMMDMVGKFCRSCVPCQERSRLRQGEHPRLEREVGVVVHLDLLFMPLGDQGYNYIFDARDNLSGFVDGPAIRTKTGSVLGIRIYLSGGARVVLKAIERLRGAGRFEEPIARIRREAMTRSEVEWRMQELRPSPVGPDGRPIRLEIGNASDFIPVFEWFMQGQGIPRDDWMQTLPLWTRKAERPLADQVRTMARDWESCRAHLREAFRRPEPPQPRVERRQRSQRQRDPEPREVRPSRKGQKTLARREEEPEPEVEERDAYLECGLGPVEFHRFAEGELRRSPACTQEGLLASEEPLRELEAHLDISQWRASPQGEERGEQAEEEPREEVLQEEVQDTQHLAAHALEHPDLEKPTPAEPREEPCQPKKEMEAEIPKRVDLRTRERAPAGKTAEEKRARRTRRIDEIWQERQRLKAAGELLEQQEERQRSEAVGALPGQPPSAPARAPEIPEMWRDFWEQRGKEFPSPVRVGFGVARKAEERLDRKIKFLAKATFDRHLLLESDLAGKKIKEVGHGVRLEAMEVEIQELRALVASQTAIIESLRQRSQGEVDKPESSRQGEQRQPGHGLLGHSSPAETRQEPPMGRVILEPEEARAQREAEREAFEFRAPTELVRYL